MPPKSWAVQTAAKLELTRAIARLCMTTQQCNLRFIFVYLKSESIPQKPLELEDVDRQLVSI
jgi:hypothetical protein